jgi:hypothetical protein
MTTINDLKKTNNSANKIDWYWIPRVIIFFLSVVFGWVIFWRKG